ncbi:hypothetical protein B0A48_01886 [Cryoendolithus antarcticus]|uniref:Uncharacterized protein n=1 Tax=Cryoendolithus antarcticus TaxID=1507870 RepID=A0A1V8TQJ8_9PEZI|nr:hypothetical protein B0A48_01886 [Cryoendolithus antarcticus]
MATPQLRSPRFPDPPQPSHQLIELLDQYLELKGVIFSRSGAVSETTIDAKDDGASSPSDLLPTHLDEHDNDLVRAAAFEPLIYQVHKSLDRHIRQATLDHLDHLYSELAAPEEIKAFAPLSITAKVTALRLKQWERENAVITPLGGSFEVLIITGLDYQGSPVRSAKLHFPWTVSWADVSKIWKANVSYALECLEEGSQLSEGKNDGGKWLVQWTAAGEAVTPDPNDVLACSTDFEALTSRLIFEMDGGVILWHERIWAESQRLRQISKDKKAAMKEDIGNDDGNGDGDGDGFDQLGLGSYGSNEAGMPIAEDEEEEMLSLGWKLVERGELSFDCDEA